MIALWTSIYFGLGILWVSWQSTSRFARQQAAASARQKRSYISAIAFVIGVFLWPLGPLGYLLLGVYRWCRRKEGE